MTDTAPLAPGAMADPRPTTVYLIRHAEPVPEMLHVYYGQQDVPLGERGLEQSRRLSERLAGVPLDAVYSSDLERAVYLAQLLGESHDLPVRQLKNFRERHMGVLQGYDQPTLERDHAELFTQWKADRVNFRVPQGENFEDLSARVIPALMELVAAFRGKRIAVVCHAGPIRVALAFAMGLPMENIFQLGCNHCSINVIEFEQEGPARVSLVNG